MKTKPLFTFVSFCLLFSAIGPGVSQADCVSSPSGLIGWWRAENNADDSINTNAATLGGGTTFTNGLVGTAFAFDGADDIAYVSALAFASVSNNFTMEMWFFPTTSRGVVTETVSSQTGIGTDQRYAVFPSHGDNSFGSGHAGAGISIGTNGITVFEHGAFYIPSPLVFNTALSGWNHMAVVYTNNRPTLYLNGTFVRTGLASPRIVHPSAEMGGGVYGYFPGFLDEYTVYNRALSAAEVQAAFAAGSSGKCVPPTLNITTLPGAVRLTWTTNVTGYLLETNSALTLPAGWGVLASNYGVLNANFAVTNAIGGATRFYRLHKP